RLRGAHHPPADRHRGGVPGRTLPAQEPRPRHGRSEVAPARRRGSPPRGSRGDDPPPTGWQRRPLRANPYLQLSPEPGNGPPHQPDPLQARRDRGRQPRPGDRTADGGTPGGPARLDRRPLTAVTTAAPPTLGEALDHARGRLAGVSQTPALDAEVLLAHVTGFGAAAIIAGARRLTKSQSAAFAGLVARRERGEPIAYLTGEREFWSLSFRVTSDVLIPRPDTETLVERALELIPGDAEQ